MAVGTEAERDSWFLVLPLRETPAHLRRSPATLAVIGLSLTAVALGGPWPEVTRALESTKEALAIGGVLVGIERWT